jgi:hypothetical protein
LRILNAENLYVRHKKKPGATARPGPIFLLQTRVYCGRIQISSSTCTEEVNVLSPTVKRTM